MKKAKPRSKQVYLRNMVFNYYNKEMNSATNSFIQKNPNISDIQFHLLQTTKEEEKIKNMLLNIAYFYDRNYIGNKDFMQIPNMKNIIENTACYPMIIASENETAYNEDILGVTTIKIENNESITDNPYFPTKNENVLSITGILTRLNLNDNCKRIRGIGKTLFKTAIKGAYNINKQNKVRLICKIDCRNKNSLKSITKAVKELQEENIDIQIFIDGYYEILNKQNHLIEAPTFILEIDLNKNQKISNNIVEFSYLNCNDTSVLSDLTNIIKENTQEIKRYINVENENIIIYHKIQPINALNTIIDVGNSANGNNRVPVLPSLQIEYAENTVI